MKPSVSLAAALFAAALADVVPAALAIEGAEGITAVASRVSGDYVTAVNEDSFGLDEPGAPGASVQGRADEDTRVGVVRDGRILPILGDPEAPAAVAGERTRLMEDL